MDVLALLEKIGVVPVVKIENASDAPALMFALCRGGLPCAEITFRTAAAEDAIRQASAACPDALIGAGTVLTPEQAERAVRAGAKFVVSPGLNPRTVRKCQELGVPVLPGCSSPTDVEAALELGLSTVKFFPAEQAGGVAFLKAISAPYSGVRFMPTGGLNLTNLPDYLAFDRVVACGGSWMVKPDWIASGDFGAVERVARETVRTALGLRLAHVGVNAENEEQARQVAALFSLLLGAPADEGEKSFFVRNEIEINKQPGYGRLGHIAVAARSVERAEWHLSRLGFHPEEESRTFDRKGLRLIYFKEDFGGFAVHLVRA